MAENGMFDICHTHHLDAPNHNIKDAYRLGFDEGVQCARKNVVELYHEELKKAIEAYKEWLNGKS